MPFVACPDCSNVVSDAAHKCPHCGKDLDQARRDDKDFCMACGVGYPPPIIESASTKGVKVPSIAIALVIVVLAFIALTNVHVCESCGDVFFGKSYANYYYGTMCLDCARYVGAGLLAL